MDRQTYQQLQWRSVVQVHHPPRAAVGHVWLAMVVHEYNGLSLRLPVRQRMEAQLQNPSVHARSSTLNDT